MKHPIDNRQWIERDQLVSNDYNPNRQVASSHDLLVRSIRESGWTQPIVVRPPNEEGLYVIVDGEHRWRASEKLVPDFGTRVPCVILEATEDECIAATVRHNRARGAHGVDSMVAIIGRLRQEGVADGKIKQHLGIDDEEFSRITTSEDAFLAIMAGTDTMMGAGCKPVIGGSIPPGDSQSRQEEPCGVRYATALRPEHRT